MQPNHAVSGYGKPVPPSRKRCRYYIYTLRDIIKELCQYGFVDVVAIGNMFDHTKVILMKGLGKEREKTERKDREVPKTLAFDFAIFKRSCSLDILP